MDESDIVFQLDESAKRGLACAPKMIPHCLEYLAAREIEKLRAVAIPAVKLLREYVDSVGGCDHTVGICICDDLRLVEEVESAFGVRPNVEFSGGAPLHGAASAGTQG